MDETNLSSNEELHIQERFETTANFSGIVSKMYRILKRYMSVRNFQKKNNNSLNKDVSINGLLRYTIVFLNPKISLPTYLASGTENGSNLNQEDLLIGFYVKTNCLDCKADKMFDPCSKTYLAKIIFSITLEANYSQNLASHFSSRLTATLNLCLIYIKII